MTEKEEHLRRKRERDRAYSAAHRDEARSRAKAWYHANKERAAITRRANYDPEWTREYNRRYRLENGEKLREYDQKRKERRKTAHKKWRVKPENSAKIVARAKEWAVKNPDKVRINRKNTAGRRRARLKMAPFEKISPSEVYISHSGVCGICHKPVSDKEFEIDHIIPIAKGGGHIRSNVQPAHRPCNKRKGARAPRPDEL